MRILRLTVVLTVVSAFASAIFLLNASAYVSRANVTLAPRLASLNTLPSKSREDVNDTNPYVELRLPSGLDDDEHALANASSSVPLRDSLRVHEPFVAARFSDSLFRPLFLPNETLRCAATDGSPRANTSHCAAYLRSQDAAHAREFKFSDRAAPSAAADAAIRDRTIRCLDASLVVVELDAPALRDAATWLTRLLMVWHVVARASASPGMLPVSGHRVVALLCPDARCMATLDGNPGRGDPFHVGSVRALLMPAEMGTDVVVAQSLASALDGLHAHVARGLPAARVTPGIGGGGVLCFRSAVHVLGFTDRFAFPDAQLGTRMAWYGRPSRDTPLSSDLLMARQLAFRPLAAPPMRAKLLYARRGSWDPRRWSPAAETAFGALLRRAANRTGFDLHVVHTYARPARPFSEQVMHYGDAAVIVGLHGDGLSLAAFAPLGARVVEIEPAYHERKHLFESLSSVGVKHEFLRLANGSDEKPGQSSELLEPDAERLEELLVNSAKAVAEEYKLETRQAVKTADGGTPVGDNGTVETPANSTTSSATVSS